VEATLFAQTKDFLVDPSLAWSDAASSWQPLGFVDLDACRGDLQIPDLPPFPLIGLGDRAHPLTRSLDAVVEYPVSVEVLTRQIQRAPHAAAVAVQLLRGLEGLPRERALTIESFCFALLQGSAEYRQWLDSRAPTIQPSPSGNVVVERRDSVLHIVIDRPWARNAIDRVLRDRLFEAFTVAALDPDIRCIKLRALGGAFSAGGDLTEFGTTADPATAHLIRGRTLPALALSRRAEILDVHVQGACVGAGLEMAAFAARLTGAPTAWFQLPELDMGLIPGAGGCVSVPRRIGRQRAALMILSGQRIDAETALTWGLIDAIEDLPHGRSACPCQR
jgi:enoyl-CoA hydratase/carnithine racemase